MIALRAPSALSAVGVALGASWDERIFPPGSHLDFDPIAAAGPSALPALIERGRALFKAKFTATGARDDRGLAGDPRHGLAEACATAKDARADLVTATGAPLTACSSTSSWSSTARSRRPRTGIRDGRKAPAATEAQRRGDPQLAITSFTCMIGSIFV